MSLLDLLNAATAPTPRSVKFNGKAPPGKSWPTGAGSPRKWDEQGGYGFSGATLIYMGNGLSEFDVVVQIGWDDAHWAEWNAFAPILEKAPSGSKAKAIDIDHPMLNRSPWKITKVVILDVTQFEQVGPGLFECRIKCKDGRVAQPALGKPDGIPGLDEKAHDPDPAIDERVKKVEELGKRLNASQAVVP